MRTERCFLLGLACSRVPGAGDRSTRTMHSVKTSRSTDKCVLDIVTRSRVVASKMRLFCVIFIRRRAYYTSTLSLYIGESSSNLQRFE